MTPTLHQIGFELVLIRRIPLLSLNCLGHVKTIQGCQFCILHVPCHCSLSTTSQFIPARMVKCNNTGDIISRVHPVNLILLQHFFDDSFHNNLLADSTFPKPLNVSVPFFRLYEHNMHNILAQDRNDHLNLTKMVAVAKTDAVVFQSLTEPLLDGYIQLNTTWPDLDGILTLVSISVAAVAIVISIMSCLKLRKLHMVIITLQQAQLVKGLSTELPQFIYTKPVSSDNTQSSFTLNFELTWDHVLFALGLLNLVFLCLTIWKYTFWRSQSKLVLEITSGDNCIFIPVLRLPLCSSYCSINLPSDISNFHLTGSWYNAQLCIDFHNLSIINNQNQSHILIPSKIKISCLEHFRLKSILRRPFCVFMYIQHNGFLTRLDDDQKNVSVN